MSLPKGFRVVETAARRKRVVGFAGYSLLRVQVLLFKGLSGPFWVPETVNEDYLDPNKGLAFGQFASIIIMSVT